MTGTNNTAFLGKPGEVIYKEIPIPTASDDNIIIKNKLIGVNFSDVAQVYGILNYTGSNIPGLESAGEIIEVGKNVTQFKVGDRVFISTGSTYTSYITIEPPLFSRVLKVPENVPYEEVVGLGIQGITAYALAYKEYKVNKGDFFLVHAAAGGTGMILVQLLKKQGGKVIATVSTQEKADFIKKYGADYTINYSIENTAERVKEITGGKGVKVVYDSVGKATFIDSLSSLDDGGLLVQYGFASGAPEGPLPYIFIGKHLKMQGFVVTAHEKEGDTYTDWFSNLFEDIRSGSLKTFISKTYTFDQVLEAIEAMSGRKTIGKLAIQL